MEWSVHNDEEAWGGGGARPAGAGSKKAIGVSAPAYSKPEGGDSAAGTPLMVEAGGNEPKGAAAKLIASSLSGSSRATWAMDMDGGATLPSK